MQFHLLTKYKIHALELGAANLVIDDIIASCRDQDTKIISNNDLAKQTLRTNKNLHYSYLITINLESRANGQNIF